MIKIKLFCLNGLCSICHSENLQQAKTGAMDGRTGMMVFQIIRPYLIYNPMINGQAAPRLLYVAYWYLLKR
jgi:hypothetical protein